jgi:membrane protein YqaA with SNARE-associated domain
MHAFNVKWAHTKLSLWILFFVAFGEASFITLPVFMFLIALTLLNPEKAYKHALIGLLGTFAGALAGYAVGHFAWVKPDGEFTGVAKFLFDIIPGFSESGYDKVQILYDKWGAGILFLSIMVPLPYNILSISSGVFDMNLLVFFAATLVSQGIKFFLLAFLTIKLGHEIRKIFDFNWKPVAIITSATVVIFVVLFRIF